MKEERIWLNPYNYVQNNPINRVDPTGMVDTNPPWKVPDVSTEENPVYYEEPSKEDNKPKKIDKELLNAKIDLQELDQSVKVDNTFVDVKDPFKGKVVGFIGNRMYVLSGYPKIAQLNKYDDSRKSKMMRL